MGELMGVGVTHYPPLLGSPESYANILRGVLQSPVLPAEMQQQWANEEELAYEHQRQMVSNLRKVRAAIDDFGPDAVIIFGGRDAHFEYRAPEVNSDEPMMENLG